MRLVPRSTFRILNHNKGANSSNQLTFKNLTTDALFAKKRVVVFAVSAAFAPTCSIRHLPRYEQLYDSFQVLGIDEVFCLSVNDPFVMYEWGKLQGANKVKLLPDGNGEFTRKMGMLVEKGNLGCGLRSWRYSMFVEDGVIKKVFVEDGFSDNSSLDPLEVTNADTMLNYLQNWREPFP